MLENNNTNDEQDIIVDFRVKRLIQVVIATEIALVVLAIHRYFFGSWEQSAIIIGVAITLLIVYFSATKRHVKFGASFFLWFVTLVISFFMWRYEGLRDETVLAFPGILIYAVILGDRKLVVSLLIFMIGTVLAIGYVNSEGIYTNNVLPSSFSAAVMMSILLVLVSFSVWLLSSDLHQLVKRLTIENKRVKNSQAQIQKLLHHDALTNLPNRILARDRFEHAVAQSNRDGTLVCIMFADLDNFKHINDSLGHTLGDKLLQAVAKDLLSKLRATDCVSRLGGDEFLIVLESIKSREEIVPLTEKIIATIKSPKQIDDHSVSVTCSIGLAICPDDGQDFETISRKADMAMYRAKDAGKNNFCFFDEQMNIDAQAAMNLNADLQKAIAENELLLHYQPKIDFRTRKVMGAEALIRWMHPVKGMISPADFIPLAESSGAIIDIGRWVINKACEDCHFWLAKGLSNIGVAVNVSPLQFKRGDIETIIRDTLERYRIPGNLLELELTESLLAEDNSELKETLAGLRQQGVKFSIDDFGTGYSNLGYLKNFDVEFLKIDQSFIRKILDNPQDKAIVTAIIQMASSLNIRTVAEGIETATVFESLNELNCDIGQGYYWSKPLSYDNFVEFVERFNQ